jgi:hypothetical protein
VVLVATARSLTLRVVASTHQLAGKLTRFKRKRGAKDHGESMLIRLYSQTKAKDFEGVGGPEDKIEAAQTERGGDQDVVGNTRQGGETLRP